MPIEAFAKQNCPIARTLAVLGERWTLLVVRELFLGERRFDAIQDRLGVASNVLSERLATLVEDGIVERRPYSERPPRFEYRLTDKGRDLLPVILTLIRWGDRYKVSKPPRVIVHTDCDHVAEAVTVCSHCGGELHAANVRAEPGPGATAAQREQDERRLRARAEPRAA